MTNTPNDLNQTLNQEKQLIFYKIMKYPIPKESECFLFNEKTKEKAEPQIRRIGEFTPTQG
jgi:hypothetical protein